MSTPRDAGMKVFRELLPGILPEGDDVSLRTDDFAGELGELAVEHVFGGLWTRPGLDRRARSLVTLGALIALGATDELRYHFRIAVQNGLTRTELEEVVYHMAGYAGFPAAAAARQVALTVFGDE